MDWPWVNDRRLLLVLLAAAEAKGVMPWPVLKSLRVHRFQIPISIKT
jgi:hypothetical protein